MIPPKRTYSSSGFNRQNFGMPLGNFGAWDSNLGRSNSRLSYHNTGGSGVPLPNGYNGQTQQAQGPPPLPPRPDQYSSMALNRTAVNRLGMSPSYGYSSFSPYSNPLYGSMYGGFGGGGYTSRMGYGADMYNYENGGNTFMRMAEESSQQAFQSIESIVQAFGSVSMMLESTYHAVYSSFRAVIGVADHFSRLRDHLAQILSTLALVRTLHWLFRKALYILGLSQLNPNSEGAWTAAAKAAVDSLDEHDLKGPRSSWPILMFLSVVFGAPWLIWRLLSSVTKNKLTEKWMTGEDAHYLAIAIYDFQGEAPKEVTFKAGNRIILAPRALQPKCRGWMLGSVDGKTSGLVPANYIKILGPRKAPVLTTRDVQERVVSEDAAFTEPTTEEAILSHHPTNQGSSESSSPIMDDREPILNEEAAFTEATNEEAQAPSDSEELNEGTTE